MKTLKDHAMALKDLAEYAADDEIDAERLAPILSARSLEEMSPYKNNLFRYLSASIFVEELYYDIP